MTGGKILVTAVVMLEPVMHKRLTEEDWEGL
jgi:hypothetical protein